jgi:hypothetical protein
MKLVAGRAGASTLTAAMLFTLVGAAPVGRPNYAVAAVYSLPISQDDEEPGEDAEECALWCIYGSAFCDAPEHYAWVEDPPRRKRGGGAHNGQPCFAGTCDEKHPACDDQRMASRELVSILKLSRAKFQAVETSNASGDGAFAA